jgi:hypothetical protein
LIGEIGPDIAAGTGLVLDHDGLAPLGLKLVSDDTGQYVINTSCAPKARTISGGRFHPESSRLVR